MNGQLEFVQVEVTTRCNFRCGFCAGRHLPQKDMALDVFQRLLQVFARPAVHPLAGGRPVGWAKIAKRAKARRVGQDREASEGPPEPRSDQAREWCDSQDSLHPTDERFDHVEPHYLTFVNPHPVKGLFVFARIAEQIARRRPEIPILVVDLRPLYLEFFRSVHPQPGPPVVPRPPRVGRPSLSGRLPTCRTRDRLAICPTTRSLAEQELRATLIRDGKAQHFGVGADLHTKLAGGPMPRLFPAHPR